MSSHQQIPIGIPTSHNPYPSIPYSQNFPDEREQSETSHLQAPLPNHPQNFYPPHHFYGYGQQPVPMNQPGQFHGVPQGFNQRPQYIMVPIDPERRELDMKISEIDKRLDNGCYFIYKVYLYICIVGSILGLIQLSGLLLIFPSIEGFKGTPATMIIIALLILVSVYAWGLHYSLVLKNAMNSKSLEGARRGFNSMIGSSIYSLVITIAMIIAAETLKKDFPAELRSESWAPYYVEAFLYLYALPTFLQLFGAKKIVNLLAERDIFVQEVKSKFGVNMMV